MDTVALRDLLIHWSEINSGSTHVAGLARMREALAAEFIKLPGARVESIPLKTTRAEALRISLHPRAPRQLLLSGHYDTVYDRNHGFQTCTLVDEDTLRGPGVADMKATGTASSSSRRSIDVLKKQRRAEGEVGASFDNEFGLGQRS